MHARHLYNTVGSTVSALSYRDVWINALFLNIVSFILEQPKVEKPKHATIIEIPDNSPKSGE